MNVHSRISGNVMYLEHFHDFYYLEAMRAGMMMAKSANKENEFRHSFERLEDDVNSAFDSVSAKIAKHIFVYIWAALLGELRHAGRLGLSYIEEIDGTSNRETVYEMSPEFEPTAESLETVRKLYAQKGWGGTYGGKNWLNIAEALLLYGKVSDATFIDHAVDLEHNGGNIFTKSAYVMGLSVYRSFDGTTFNANDLRYFLNDKFAHDILSHYDTYFTRRVSRKVYSLLERYNNIVSPVKSLKYIAPSLPTLTDFSVNWGSKTFTVSEKSDDDEFTTHCYYCEKGITVDHEHWSGNCVCNRCYERKERNTVQCKLCGEHVDRYNTTYIDGEDQTWCDDCAWKHKQACAECGYDFHQENMVTSEEGSELCERCAAPHTCNECGKVYANAHAHEELPIDADGIFSNDFDIPYAIHYAWNKGNAPHTHIMPNKQLAMEFVSTLKTAKAAKIEVEALTTKVITNDLTLKIGSTKKMFETWTTDEACGLWAIYTDGQFVVMTPCGLWAKADGTLNGSLVAIDKLKNVIDWTKIQTVKEWEHNVPQDKKSIISKIFQGG